MKILFITDNYPPEYNAPATRTAEHAQVWREEGVEVTIVTCVPNFPTGTPFRGFRNRLLQREYVGGLEVLRVWSYMAPNAGVFRRILDFASFGLTSFLVGLFVECDIVIATSPQFFTAISAFGLAKLRRKPWVFEVRDLWPESIRALGALRNPTLLRLLERVELALYRDAASVVTVTDAIRDNLVRRGVPEEKVKVVPNGFDNRRAEKSRLQSPDPNGGFTVGYVGTIGMAHGLDVLLDAAAILEEEDGDEVRWVVVGDGADKQRLLGLAEDLELRTIEFRPAVPKEQVTSLLRQMSAVVVPLRRLDVFRMVLPSKIFEAAAMQRPVILGVQGQAKELVIDRYHAGVAFTPEDGAELASAVRALVDDPEVYKECQRGCRRLAKDFHRPDLARDMLNHIRVAASRAHV